jgi:hypothetical protein
VIGVVRSLLSPGTFFDEGSMCCIPCSMGHLPQQCYWCGCILFKVRLDNH